MYSTQAFSAYSWQARQRRAINQLHHNRTKGSGDDDDSNAGVVTAADRRLAEIDSLHPTLKPRLMKFCRKYCPDKEDLLDALILRFDLHHQGGSSDARDATGAELTNEDGAGAAHRQDGDSGGLNNNSLFSPEGIGDNEVGSGGNNTSLGKFERLFEELYEFYVVKPALEKADHTSPSARAAVDGDGGLGRRQSTATPGTTTQLLPSQQHIMVGANPSRIQATVDRMVDGLFTPKKKSSVPKRKTSAQEYPGEKEGSLLDLIWARQDDVLGVNHGTTAKEATEEGQEHVPFAIGSANHPKQQTGALHQQSQIAARARDAIDRVLRGEPAVSEREAGDGEAALDETGDNRPHQQYQDATMDHLQANNAEMQAYQQHQVASAWDNIATGSSVDALHLAATTSRRKRQHSSQLLDDSRGEPAQGGAPVVAVERGGVFNGQDHHRQHLVVGHHHNNIHMTNNESLQAWLAEDAQRAQGNGSSGDVVASPIPGKNEHPVARSHDCKKNEDKVDHHHGVEAFLASLSRRPLNSKFNHESQQQPQQQEKGRSQEHIGFTNRAQGATTTTWIVDDVRQAASPTHPQQQGTIAAVCSPVLSHHGKVALPVPGSFGRRPTNHYPTPSSLPHGHQPSPFAKKVLSSVLFQDDESSLSPLEDKQHHLRCQEQAQFEATPTRRTVAPPSQLDVDATPPEFTLRSPDPRQPAHSIRNVSALPESPHNHCPQPLSAAREKDCSAPSPVFHHRSNSITPARSDLLSTVGHSPKVVTPDAIEPENGHPSPPPGCSATIPNVSTWGTFSPRTNVGRWRNTPPSSPSPPKIVKSSRKCDERGGRGSSTSLFVSDDKNLLKEGAGNPHYWGYQQGRPTPHQLLLQDDERRFRQWSSDRERMRGDGGFAVTSSAAMVDAQTSTYADRAVSL